MKRVLPVILGAVALVSMYAFVSVTSKKAAVYTVSTDASKIEWKAANAGGPHSGTFPLKSGQLNVDGGKLTGGTFIIDLTNLKADADGLTTHLKTKDFFEVETFAQATFEITGVTYTSATAADIAGKLTLKGVSAPVKFSSTITGADDKKFSATATFNIDRTLVGITWGPGRVNNDVAINVTLVAAK